MGGLFDDSLSNGSVRRVDLGEVRPRFRTQVSNCLLSRRPKPPRWVSTASVPIAGGCGRSALAHGSWRRAVTATDPVENAGAAVLRRARTTDGIEATCATVIGPFAVAGLLPDGASRSRCPDHHGPQHQAPAARLPFDDLVRYEKARLLAEPELVGSPYAQVKCREWCGKCWIISRTTWPASEVHLAGTHNSTTVEVAVPAGRFRSHRISVTGRFSVDGGPPRRSGRQGLPPGVRIGSRPVPGELGPGISGAAHLFGHGPGHRRADSAGYLSARDRGVYVR